MSFPKIEVPLTDQQLEALKGFADEIRRDSSKNLLGEVFVLPTSYLGQSLVVRLMDAPSVALVKEALKQAEREYDQREEKRHRLQIIQTQMRTVLLLATLNDDALIINKDGHRYELREVE